MTGTEAIHNTERGLATQQIRHVPTDAEMLEAFEPHLVSATAAGVPEELVERARSYLLELQSSEHAGRLLEAFVKLAGGKSPGRYTYNFPELLDSDDQRLIALRLVKKALASAKRPDDIESLTVQKFRLSKASPIDQDVVKFVSNGMDEALMTRHGGHQSRKKHFNYHDARDALVEAKEIFDRYGKRFFLDRGTLLGAVREGGFIASDYDIDVGVFGDEVTLDEIKEMFADSSFRLTQDFEYKVGVVSSAGIQFDFFLTTRESGYFLSKGFRSIHNWWFSPFDLMEFEFLGQTFLIPDTYEKHLDENYGNWRNAAIFYDLSYDEPCQVYGRSAASTNYLNRRLARALRKGWKFYAQEAAIRLKDDFGQDFTDWFPIREPGLVAPRLSSRREIRPIIVVDAFDEYTHRHRRLIESALSITPDLNLVVHGDGTTDDVDQRVAGGIDRVSKVSSVLEATESALISLLDDRPRAMVVTLDVAKRLSAQFAHQLRQVECELVVFEDRSVALTLDEHGQVIVRNP